MATGSTVFAQQIPIDPSVRTGKLPNGQTYYIRHNEMPKGRADFYLVQKVGSVLEEESQRGLAHFLEHMAFNGSKNFPGNSIITELEKKGIRFGSNINASTSYDETIYKLTDIPLNREGIIDTALLVLHDWAGFLTLNDKDIDEERGVIREEWRLSAGGTLRVLQNDIFPVIYAGTPYANRIPIGSIDVVNNFKYQELRDYYKKWYRPDLQGIIVVGDVDVDKVEAKIKKLFADIPAPLNPAPRVYFTIPENTEPIIVYGLDKEITGAQLNVSWSMESISDEAKSTVAGYTKSQVNQVIAGLLNARFWDIRERAGAPFSTASASVSGAMVSSKVPVWYFTIGQKNKNEILRAFDGLFTEIQRMRRFGFTKAEVDNLKKGVYASAEKQYTDRDHRTNRDFVSEYTKHFLTGEPAPGIEWEYENIKKIVSQLSIDTLNHYAKKVMGDKNLVIYALATEKDHQLPAKEDLRRTWEEAKIKQLQPYVYKEISDQLLERKPIKGKITKTEIKAFGFTKWNLSNGAKVYFKRTDYKEDKVMLTAYSIGGVTQVNNKDLPSGKLAGMANWGGFGKLSLHDLEKALTGKDALLQGSIGEFTENIEGGSSIKDIETLFQLAFLKMTVPPLKDQQYYDTWIKGAKDGLKDRYKEPNVVFNDSVVDIMSNNHPRAIRYDRDSNRINTVNYDKVLQIYRERFADASDFTFFITGNVSADSIKPLVETYIGGLPALNKPEKVKDHGIKPPKGIVRKHFTQAMVTPKSSIYVAYTGEGIPYTLQNELLMSYVGRILTFNYNENMREKEGGVYYVNPGGWIERFPKEHFTFKIQFATDPDSIKKAKLMKIMYAEIDKLVTDGPTSENVNKAKANMVKIIRENGAEKNANYWNSIGSHFFTYGIDRYNNYEKIAQAVTPDMVRAFAKKIFKQGNLVEIVMDPEKK